VYIQYITVSQQCIFIVWYRTFVFVRCSAANHLLLCDGFQPVFTQQLAYYLCYEGY